MKFLVFILLSLINLLVILNYNNCNCNAKENHDDGHSANLEPKILSHNNQNHNDEHQVHKHKGKKLIRKHKNSHPKIVHRQQQFSQVSDSMRPNDENSLKSKKGRMRQGRIVNVADNWEKNPFILQTYKFVQCFTKFHKYL
jgi:hypothetical protein